MFGFLRISRQGLSQSHKALYKAHFCAACHSMAGFGGRPAALLANYDQTLLLLVLGALQKNDDSRPLPCTAFPLRRVAVQQMTPSAAEAVAALNIALIDAKLRDDELDDGGWRPRVIRRVLSARTGKAHEVLRSHGFPLHILDTLAERQSAAEAEGATLDSLAQPTAGLMEAVFGFVADLAAQPSYRVPLQAVGDALGRYLYVWDALCDRQADRQRGRFNAIDAGGGDLESVRHYLTRQINLLERSLRLLPLGYRQPLVDGLLVRMRQRLQQVLPRPRLSLAQSLYRWRVHRRQQAGDCDAGCCDAADCGSCACDCIDCSACCSGGWGSFLGVVILVLLILLIIGWYSSTHKQHNTTGPTPSPSVASSSRPSPRPLRTGSLPAPSGTVRPLRGSPSSAPNGGVGKPISH